VYVDRVVYSSQEQRPYLSAHCFRSRQLLLPTTLIKMAARLLSLILFCTTIALDVYAQCDNYGIQNGANCTCPPGVGGADCSLPVCGGTLYEGPRRPTVQPSSGALYGNLSSCTCPDGWSGVACNGSSRAAGICGC